MESNINDQGEPLASFPWYDLPAVHWATEQLWKATKLVGLFSHETDPQALWRSPNLVVTQACGLDLYLSDVPIEPIAAPVFDLDCEEGTYFSHIVGSRHGRIAAVNSMSSHSGLSALLSLCQPECIVVTGSHRSSLAKLQSGEVDVAAIDAVTWRILARTEPSLLEGIKLLDRSDNAPSPPYVIRKGDHPEKVLGGLRRCMTSREAADARLALTLKGVVRVQRDDYAPIHHQYLSVVSRIAELDVRRKN